MDATRPLTPAQVEQLRLLLDAGALSRDTGKGPYAPGMAGLNPSVVGYLRNKGLAESRGVRPAGGPQFTAYWLTERGQAEARRLAGAGDAEAAAALRSTV